MEEVICSCIRCNLELGRFKNSWNGIGSTYFSPVYPPVSYINGFEATGAVYGGAVGTQVENSFVQDLACRKCKTVIGMLCESAPEGHLLTENQLILRLVSMNVISAKTGRKAMFSIQEKFALTRPGAKDFSIPPRASTVQPMPRSQTPTLFVRKLTTRSINESTSGSTNGSPSGNMSAPLNPAKSQQDLEKFKSWAANAISKQKEDIDRIGGAVQRIENGMSAFRNFLQEIRADLTANRQEHPTQEDLAVIREDLNGFRDEFSSYQHAQQPRQQDMTIIREKLNGLRQDIDLIIEPSVSPHDFNVLIRDVQKVDKKSNAVGLLKDEFEALKVRLDATDEGLRLERLRNALLFKNDYGREEAALEGYNGYNGNETQSGDIVDLDVDGQSPFVDPRNLEIRRAYVPDSPLPETPLDTPRDAPPTIRDSEESEGPPEMALDAEISSQKRKHERTEELGDDGFNPEPPAKKTERATNLASVRRKEQKSKRGPSLLPGETDEKTPDVNQSKAPPQLQLQNPTVSQMRKRGRPRTVSLNKPVPVQKELSNHRTASLPRTPSSNATSQSARSTIEVDHLVPSRHPDSVSSFKTRTANGVLLTPSGKIDGRSLRAKMRRVSDKETEAPLRSSEAPFSSEALTESNISNAAPRFCNMPLQDDGPVDEAVNKAPFRLSEAPVANEAEQRPLTYRDSIPRLPTESVIEVEEAPPTPRDLTPAAPLLTIGKAKFQIVLPKIRAPDLASFGLDTEKPYHCVVCGKRYKHVGAFERHKLLPACADVEDAELSLSNLKPEKEAKRQIAERKAAELLQLLSSPAPDEKRQESPVEKEDQDDEDDELPDPEVNEERKRKITERERLVKMALEREL